MELLDDSLKNREKIEELTSENKRLKEQLAVARKIRFENNAYYLGQDGPFCMNCYDSDKNLFDCQNDQDLIHYNALRQKLLDQGRGADCQLCLDDLKSSNMKNKGNIVLIIIVAVAIIWGLGTLLKRYIHRILLSDASNLFNDIQSGNSFDSLDACRNWVSKQKSIHNPNGTNSMIMSVEKIVTYKMDKNLTSAKKPLNSSILEVVK